MQNLVPKPHWTVVFCMLITAFITAQTYSAPLSQNKKDFEIQNINQQLLSAQTQPAFYQGYQQFKAHQKATSFLYDRDAPTFSDAVYTERIQNLTINGVPLVYNARVRDQIEAYTLKFRDLSERILGLSEIYFPIIDPIFIQNRVPIELKYLTIPESALDWRTTSHAGAAGIWQFIPSTAKEYFLEVNSTCDERLDIYKSTAAAAAYFNDLYDQFHDWILVVAAYNCGPSTLSRAIVKAGSSDYWKIQHLLPKETQNYVPTYIACVYWANYYFEHHLNATPPLFPNAYASSDTIGLNAQTYLANIAYYTNTDPQLLAFLNPQYKDTYVPYKGYTQFIRLPIEKISEFRKHKNTICGTQYAQNNSSLSFFPKATAAPTAAGVSAYIEPTKPLVKTVTKTVTNTETYKVKKGNTLSEIAKKLGCSIETLKRQNHLKTNTLKTGQVLKLYTEKKVNVAVKQTGWNWLPNSPNMPPPAPAVAPIKTEEPTNNSSLLYAEELILLGNNTATPITPTFNNSTTATNNEGEIDVAHFLGKTEMPAPPPLKENTATEVKKTTPAPKKVEPKHLIYTTKADDVLSVIAKRYNCTVGDIKDWNDLKTDIISGGKRLLIYPNATETAPAKKTETVSKNTPAPKSTALKYTVKNGDTISEIAKKLGVTTKLLFDLNEISPKEPIKPGMVLKYKK